MMDITLEFYLDREQYGEILSDVNSRRHEEACGLVGGIRRTALKIYPITNSKHSATRFLMDGKEQIQAMLDIEKNGWDMIAIYHSHIQGAGGEPSEVDQLEYSYPGVVYLIISFESGGQVIRGFNFVDNRWIEISIKIAD